MIARRSVLHIFSQICLCRRTVNKPFRYEGVPPSLDFIFHRVFFLVVLSARRPPRPRRCLRCTRLLPHRGGISLAGSLSIYTVVSNSARRVLPSRMRTLADLLSLSFSIRLSANTSSFTWLYIAPAPAKTFCKSSCAAFTLGARATRCHSRRGQYSTVTIAFA